MTGDRMDAIARGLGVGTTRRPLLSGIAGAGLWLGAAKPLTATTAKKKRHKHNKHRNPPPPVTPLCTSTGKRCETPGADCRANLCLKAPLSIAATWTNVDADHDTILYVPANDPTTGPFPYIYFACNPNNSFCVEAYPFACISQDATGPGDEVTTIYRLLPGRYEYWIELVENVSAGDLLVTLSDGSGRIVREWSSPANATNDEVGWHVFDIDPDGSVNAIDTLPPGGFPSEENDVCPYLA